MTESTTDLRPALRHPDAGIWCLGVAIVLALPVWLGWLIHQSGGQAWGWVLLDAAEWVAALTLVVSLSRGRLAAAGRAAGGLAILLASDAVVDLTTSTGTELHHAIWLATLVELPLALILLGWERRSRRTLMGATAAVESAAVAEVSRRA